MLLLAAGAAAQISAQPGGGFGPQVKPTVINADGTVTFNYSNRNAKDVKVWTQFSGDKDTVEMLDCNQSKGNGFIFDNYDSNGLFWAMDQAMAFYMQGQETREREVKRIMSESLNRFNHAECAKQYIKLYERMLDRPLVKDRG